MYGAKEKRWEGSALAFHADDIHAHVVHVVSDKSLASRIYIELLQLNQKTNDPILKRAKDLNRHFSQGDIQVPKKRVKRCSTSSAVREMQIKTTMRHHSIPSGVAGIKRTDGNSKDVAWREQNPQSMEGKDQQGRWLGKRSGSCSNG